MSPLNLIHTEVYAIQMFLADRESRGKLRNYAEINEPVWLLQLWRIKSTQFPIIILDVCSLWRSRRDGKLKQWV